MFYSFFVYLEAVCVRGVLAILRVLVVQYLVVAKTHANFDTFRRFLGDDRKRQVI